MWMKAGMAPRRSSSVCSLMAALVERNGAQSNKLRHRSIVLESSAYTVLSRSTPSESPAYSLRARRISTAARSDQMRQSRDSLASASVERLTAERKPIAYSLLVFADRLASMSRRLSRQVSCAKAMARNCSAHDSVRTPALPPWRCTMRAKLVQGTNSMT